MQGYNMTSKKISFITGNPKKFSEVAKNISPKIILEQLNIDLIEPQILSLREISAYKAKQAFEIAKKPVIVEDSGAFFDTYNEFPWAFTKFIFNQLGIEGLKKVLHKSNTGKFVTILSYMDDTLWEPLQFIWEITGKFAFDHIQWKIDHHMPYNHIFYPETSQVPAIMIYEQRTQDNHRQRAVKVFNEWIENL